MTDDALIVSPEVLAQAEAIVHSHVVPRETATGLLDAIARALQIEVNRAELAEIERRQAVATLQRRVEQLRTIASIPVSVPWVECHRCGVRAPTTGELEHDERCALSLRPPPRLSLVSPKRDAEEDDIA